ncbi:MAG TPA: triose-phosphate isomerase [Acidimicrobiia bacterium]|nr:triose-phosphate isomerase [Acidimicrobiia bacterium]
MTDRTPLIVGNWKMNANHLEAIQMVQKLSYRLEAEDYERVDVVVAPPFTSLRSIQVVIEQDRIPVSLGAQNVFWAESGAYTGEISAPMLAKLAVKFVIVGHSERREHFGESDEMVNKKATAVIAAGMTAIVCVGETLEQREVGEAETVVTTQLTGALRSLSLEDPAKLAVAYEPVWAIGTGRTALPDDAATIATIIREQLRDTLNSEVGGQVRVLYGGSVNAVNIKDFMAKKDIDGALVGGASLDPDQFAAIVRYRL